MNPTSLSNSSPPASQLDFFTSGNGIAPGVPADMSAGIKAGTGTSQKGGDRPESSAGMQRSPKQAKKEPVVKTSPASSSGKSAAKRIRNKEHQKARRARLKKGRISSVMVELTESAQIFYAEQAKAEGVKLKVYFRNILNELNGVVATAIRTTKNKG